MNMRILVACERSYRVTGAFRARGHDAWSCDIVNTDGDINYHIQDDVLNHLCEGWEMMIAFPPCTFLCVSGARWFDHPLYPNRRIDQRRAVGFVLKLASAPIEKIAIENPVGILSSVWRRPDQIIEPYYFGDEASKRTCLWLKNLQPLRWGRDVQMAFNETRPPQTEVVGIGEHIIFRGGESYAEVV